MDNGQYAEYKIIYSDRGPGLLTQLVNEHLQQGYQVYGSPMVVQHPKDQSIVLYQAVVK